MRNTKFAIAATAVVAVISLAGCSSSTTTAAKPVAATTTAPAPVASTSAPMATPTAATVGTIVDVAAANPDFTTLVAAIKAAGLASTLSGAGPFTVFAPTNSAFSKLPKGLLEKLLLPANKAVLVKILTYHVVAGKVMAADVMAGDVATVEGKKIVLATAGGVTVNKAKVIATDVAASNGVIHVIDTVLVPSDVNIAKL